MNRTKWDFYLDYVHKLDPILWFMGKVHGVRIDNDERLKLQRKLTRRVDRYKRQASKHAPVEIRSTKRYKNFPTTDLPIISVPTVKPVKVCSVCGEWPVTKSGHTTRKGGQKGIPLNRCHKAEIISQEQTVNEYDVLLPFNALSGDQLKAYAKHFKHPLALNKETGERNVLNEDQLKKLVKRFGKAHPIYKLVKAGKKVNTTLTRYVNVWVPDERGYIYGRYTHNPETFRLAQQDHNLMNVSHRGDIPYAHEIRKLVIPSEGCVFVEADSASIEAVMSGWFMGSESYMEIARQGVHAFAACTELGLPFTPENKALVKNDPRYALLYARKKRITHGVTYGMGAKLLHESYPESFPTISNATAEIRGFLKMLPELANWHEDLRKEAWRNGYLDNPWGLRNYYYQVYTKDNRTQTFKPGEDANKVVAFKPQSSNAMFQRENLILLGASWAAPHMCAIGHIHDSQALDCPIDRVNDAVVLLKSVMKRPIKQMGGLIIDVEIKVGPTWADMRTVDEL